MRGWVESYYLSGPASLIEEVGELDKELKSKWIEALQSGKYKQGTNFLRAPAADGTDCYCCLGVLCDLVDPAGWGAVIKDTLHSGLGLKSTVGFRPYAGMSQMLSNALSAQVGLSQSSAKYLASMNDRNYDFLSISQWIEDHVP